MGEDSTEDPIWDDAAGDADSIWGTAVKAAEEAGSNEEALRREFQEWAGSPPGEASAGELRAFLDRDPSDDAPRVRAARTPPVLDVELLEDDWVRASGTSLAQSVDLRLAMRDGRPRVVGLRVDNGQEVTADFLREIRLGRIVETLMSDLDPGQEPNMAGVKFKEREAVLWDWAAPAMFTQQLLDRLPESEQGESTAAKRGTPPPDSALRNFARVLAQKRMTKPHGAMAAAAREVHIARSTAYRWADLCRDRGYLPQEEGHDG